MIREFFYLQKSDRKVILVLLCVMAIALGGIFLAGEENRESNALTPADSLAGGMPLSGRSGPGRHRDAGGYAVAPRRVERFVFDPNTADSTELLRLGLRPWQVRNIYKYRAAGGVYRRPSDFARLYGLTVGQYRELEPYIRISRDYLPASTLLRGQASETVARDTAVRAYPVKLGETERMVLNTADTTALQRIPGIGPYYAREIVRYGERLGGYVSVDQLDEIEDFPSGAKRYLIVRSPAPRRLNVNRLSLSQLRRHPYISFYQARTITDYRRLHGPIKSLNDLRLSKDFPPEAIERLTPYVEY